jgi:hypothetical protein
MKRTLTTLLLVFTLSLFSGFASAQETPRVCYNTTVKVKSYDKEGKENKEGKEKLKDNCIELSPESVTLTNHKGKTTVYKIDSYEMMLTQSGIAYLLHTKVDGKDYQLLVHGDLEYFAVHDVKKNVTVWYFMQL